MTTAIHAFQKYKKSSFCVIFKSSLKGVKKLNRIVVDYYVESSPFKEYLPLICQHGLENKYALHYSFSHEPYCKIILNDSAPILFILF